MVNSTCMDFKKIEAMKEDFKKRGLNVLKNSVLKNGLNASVMNNDVFNSCLLYTDDAADDAFRV